MFFIQTRDEIEEQERTILDLEAAVKAKEAPLKLAETRLENRDISHSLDSHSYHMRLLCSFRIDIVPLLQNI